MHNAECKIYSVKNRPCIARTKENTSWYHLDSQKFHSRSLRRCESTCGNPHLRRGILTACKASLRMTKGRISASKRNNGRTRMSLPIDPPTPGPCSPAFSIPLSTNRGSLQGYLRVLFRSKSLHILGIIPRNSSFCQDKRIRMQSVKCKVQSDGIA